HYLTGMKLVEKEDVDGAGTRFKRALDLDSNFSPAIAGQALVSSLRSEKETDKEHRAVDVEKALQSLKRAKSESDKDDETFITFVTGIRVMTHAQPEDWLEDAEDYYEDAVDIDDEDLDKNKLPYYRAKEAAHYFMGEAYLKAGKFRKGEDMLDKVVSSSAETWREPARKIYEKLQKIKLASSNYTLSGTAKQIAFKDEVLRADVAALLVDELKISKLFSGRIPDPGTDDPKPSFIPADVTDHPLKDEIVTVLKWQVRGLEPRHDATTKANLFYPQDPIVRKELAFVLEDVLIKLTEGKTSSTKFFSQDHSPFPDVSTSVSWYNAVLACVSRNLMKTDLSGAFRPNDSVNGAELLLAITRLRDIMNY
ncbi:MAG: hypothetical protein B6245_17545, partial [Desulfobacteraceae bacterium 4572_88]